MTWSFMLYMFYVFCIYALGRPGFLGDYQRAVACAVTRWMALTAMSGRSR